MFGATQMPFYGKYIYSPQTMYFHLLEHPLLGHPLLGRPLLRRRSPSWETHPKGGYSQLVYIYIIIYIHITPAEI